MLVVVEGPAEGQKFALGEHQLVLVGRDHDATFQILDGRISRHHLQIKRMGAQDAHAAIDLNSANGVCVNDQQVTSETPLANGDLIRIGNSSILYSAEDDPDAQTISQLFRQRGVARYQTELNTREPPAN
jgi:pSer/pThr/pTyr-binding forkhead associated (FHA) protein